MWCATTTDSFSGVLCIVEKPGISLFIACCLSSVWHVAKSKSDLLSFLRVIWMIITANSDQTCVGIIRVNAKILIHKGVEAAKLLSEYKPSIIKLNTDKQRKTGSPSLPSKLSCLT